MLRDVVEILFCCFFVLAFIVGWWKGVQAEGKQPRVINPISREQEQITRYIDESFQHWD